MQEFISRPEILLQVIEIYGMLLLNKRMFIATQPVVVITHVSELLGTRLGLLASICQSTARNQVMTRL